MKYILQRVAAPLAGPEAEQVEVPETERLKLAEFFRQGINIGLMSSAQPHGRHTDGDFVWDSRWANTTVSGLPRAFLEHVRSNGFVVDTTAADFRWRVNRASAWLLGGKKLPSDFMHSHPIVLCPMEIERKAVEQELRAAGLDSIRVIQTGIGKDAIIARVRGLAPSKPSGLILAGACGGLAHVDDVPPIARIVDEHGHEWTSGIGFVPSGRVLIAVDRIVATPAEKRALADHSGAAIVDMESHAFAAECEHLGIAWSVVRGVSDTPDESLPNEVLGWVTPEGGTRSGRAVLDMLKKPSLIPHIVGVLRRSNRVLPLVGRRVVELIRSLERGGTMAP